MNETPGDALIIARRAYLRALGRAIEVRGSVLSARKSIERAERALTEGRHGDAANALLKARHALYKGHGWPREARIDGEVRTSSEAGFSTHRFLGMWHPPVPPESPQQLGCSAVVCTCLEQLTDEVQVRQHWEAGCFDLPDFQKLPDPDPEWEQLPDELKP